MDWTAGTAYISPLHGAQFFIYNATLVLDCCKTSIKTTCCFLLLLPSLSPVYFFSQGTLHVRNHSQQVSVHHSHSPGTKHTSNFRVASLCFLFLRRLHVSVAEYPTINLAIQVSKM